MSRLLKVLLTALGRLPLSVLYVLSDGLAFVGWHVVGYRKKVVLDNLRGSFPEWSEREVRGRGRRCYGVFFEGIAESVKLFGMRNDELLARMPLENPEDISVHTDQGRSVIGYGGHYGNFEMAGLSFPLQLDGVDMMAIYSPLKNKPVNELLSQNRSRNGTLLVSRRLVGRYFRDARPRPAIEFFIADQSPSHADWTRVHWTTFLGRPTSFLAGPERFARRYDRAVYYTRIRRLSRGQYSARLVLVTEHPNEEAPGYITERMARLLEADLRGDPLPWLWTHRRWKRAAPPEVVKRLETEPFIPAGRGKGVRREA